MSVEYDRAVRAHKKGCMLNAVCQKPHAFLWALLAALSFLYYSFSLRSKETTFSCSGDPHDERRAQRAMKRRDCWAYAGALSVLGEGGYVKNSRVWRGCRQGRSEDVRSHLKLQRLRLLPREALVGEMPIPRRAIVNRLRQVQLLDNDTRPHVEVLADDAHELVAALVARAVRLDEEGQRLGDADGVRELHERAARQLGVDERLGDPAGEICGAAVDFAVVLAGEGATAVRAPAAVRVDDDFAACEAGVALRAANDEEAGGLDLGGVRRLCVGLSGYENNSRGRRSYRRGISRE